jgi:2-iminobutanoate/2-iminopropanoate deaminase
VSSDADFLKMWDEGGGRQSKSAGGARPAGRALPADALDWEHAPFRLLGKNGKSFWFFDRKGELVEYPHSALGQWPTLLALCGGNDEWLVEHFPAFDELVKGDVVAQAEQVRRNLEAVPAPFGAGLDDALMARVYLTSFADYDAFNAAYRTWFRGPLPSRTCVGVTGLAVGAAVEIDLIVGLQEGQG